MKGFFLILLAFLLLFSLIQQGIFAIIPQPLEAKQWVYILVTLASFLGLLLLHISRNGRKGLYLFFLTYPFLAQSVHYLNISASSFILTPAFLYLAIHLLLSKERALPASLQILFLFCFSILASVLVAENKYTAFAFFVLAVGGFTLSAYLMYVRVRTSRNPLLYIRGVVLAILAGSVLYFALETVTFQIRPNDIPAILMRRWHELPMGRYYTGGYKEPAGLGFVYSLLFWVVLFFVQTNSVSGSRIGRWIDKSALLATMFFLLVAGTRSALINVVNVFLVLELLRRKLGLQSVYKLRTRYVVTLIILVSLGAYLLIPRTILTSRSRTPPSWIEPTYVSIGQRTFQLVGTTANYYKHTLISFEDFLHHPLGSGPLNATLIKEDITEGGFAYYYSILSNLVVVGATFGWLSLLIWLIFVLYMTRSVLRLRVGVRNKLLCALTMVFLAILLASLLPGSPYLGPSLNWSNFNRLLPLSPQTPGLPSDYLAVISGIIVGGLAGLLERSRQDASVGT